MLEVIKKTINMDLELYPNISAPIIEGYGHGYVNISGNKLTKTFILFPDKFIELDFENIKEITNAVNLCKIQLDLIIYGSLNSLDKSKYLNLKSSISIPIEFMHTNSACRTWSVLIAEGRNIGAIIEPTKIEN